MDTKHICTVCGKTLTANAPEGLCPECLLKAGLGTGVDMGADTEGGGEKKTRFVPPTIEELAAKFPQLEILEFIGQGGMGAVYKTRQKQLDRIVALKILPPQTGERAGFAERFTREARALARLNHPHIVTLYEFGQADGLFYFLMEFVDGVNLRQLLNTSRIAPKEALAIVPQICEALQFAHDAGIVHRDIKPENILLDKKGQVKIADFGVAKMIAESLTEAAEKTTSPSGELTEAGSTLGTPQYMAPEQIKNSAEVDHRADIYSLGVVFYQMLTGELPSGKIEPPSRKVQIDVRLDEIVLRALEKKPELRFQQASDVKTLVETIATTPPPPQTPSPAAPAGWKHYKDSRWGFELDLPAGWSPFPPLYSNSPYEIIRFLSHENGKHALILFRKPHDPAKSLKDDAEKAQQHLAKTGFGNFVSSETTIGSQPAHILDFDRPQDGGTWSCREYFVAEGTLGYVVGFGTTDKTNLFETFERVAQSFRFKTSGYELKNVELSSLGYGQELIPWFADPKTKTAPANEPAGAAEGADITPFTSQIIPIEPDLVRLRWQTIVLGLAMAAACLVLGPAARPPVLGWAIATWGVALFIISNLLILSAGNSRKIITLAWRIVIIDFAGYLAAEVWCAHLHHLSWQVAVILGSSLAVAWSFRKAAKKGAVQSPCPPPPRGRFLLVILLFAVCIIGSGAIVALFIRPFPQTAPSGSVIFHFREFEADASSVDQLIPVGQRSNGVQPGEPSNFPQGVPGSSTTSIGNFQMTTHGGETESQVASVSPAVFAALLHGIAPKPGLLTDRTRLVTTDWWRPGLADGWSYSFADGTFQGGGDVSGFLGLRQKNGALNVRLECLIGHTLDTMGPGVHPDVNSSILFAGPPPKDGELVFLVPFLRHDGTPHYLVLALDFNNDGSANVEPPGRVLAGPPFAVPIQQGRVELAFVGDEPWTNPVCWYPNGQPSPKAFPTGNISSSYSALDTMIGKKFVFYINDEGTNGVSMPFCRANGPSGTLPPGSVWEAPSQWRRQGYFGVDLVCPSNALTVNLSLGVANRPWETVVSMEHAPNAVGGVSTSGGWSGRYESVRGTNGDVAVGCSYTARSNWVSRIVYVNDAGQIVPIHETSVDGDSETPASGTLLVSSNEYAHMKAFLVQRRKYQWVEFDNVSLQEGNLTQVSARGADILGQPPQINAAADSQAIRQRFVPVEGMESKTTWGVENDSQFNPDGWAVTANMTLGGVVRIQPWMVAHSQPPTNQPPGDDLCHIKLVKGDDDAISLNVSDLSAHNILILDLKRDQWTGVTVNGVSYRIGYCSVWVAPNQPDTAPYAQVVVTHSTNSELPRH